MHKLTSGALVVALTGTAVTVPATINPTAHYAEAQGLLGLGGQALQGLVEKGEAKVAELESQLWKADLALKGAQAVLEMKRWGVVLAIGEENKKAKQAEYDQQKLLVDSAELLVRTTKTSLDAARKTLAVTKKQLEDFNGKDPSAYEDAPEPDTKPVALPTNLREALESITAQQEAVAKRQALFDEADSAYTKRKKEVDSSWFSWLAPSNTKELEGLKNRRDARKAKLDLEQARLDNITRSIELFEAVEAETPAHDGHGADRYDATTPTNVDDASRQLEFANSTLEAATHRKANIEANLAALTDWQERNPFTGFWRNADKWTLERALRAADNEIADATKRIADKAAALEELKNAPAETEPSAPEGVEPSETETAEPSATVEPSAAAEPTEESAPRTPEPSESEAHAEPESPETSSEESAATSTPATTSTSAPEESAARTTEASESVEPADTSAEPEDQIDIDELTQNLDEAKKLEQDMLDLQKLLQQYINKPEAETTKPSETEVTPTTVTEVSAATSAPATTSVPTSEVSAARTTETTEPATEDSAARTTEETAPTAESSAARTTPTEIPSSEQSAPRTTTSAKLSTVAVVPATSSEVSAARTTEAAEPTTEVSAATSTPATTAVPTSEVSAARTTEAAKPTTEVSAAASAPATTAAPTSSEVSAARTTERPEPTAESSAARTTPTEIPSSQQSAPRTTEAAKPTTEVSAATPAPATTSTPTSEVSAARTTEETEPTAEDSAPRTTEAAKPTTEVSAATSTPATRPGSSAPRTTSQAPETTQQAKPTQQTEGAASGAEGSSASSWLWLILPLLLALGFGGAAYADLIPGVRLPRM
ncbi:hypothetical protein [Corynebacterium pseudogenitalium]|uniref:hypothetical protein n=1 Tax=Corynebacterium pseudogenitalium TaxID=38303 RepID=UPI00210D01A0|nr:hypothetical protein [Corynebacterium pseudogenitalium]MCQ4608100.1 hypothetical protein [Corynebacterium pseudogenitalium]